MGNHDQGAASFEFFEGFLNLQFAEVVEALVASSRIQIGGWLRKTRARDSRCFCPPERLPPRSTSGSS